MSIKYTFRFLLLFAAGGFCLSLQAETGNVSVSFEPHWYMGAGAGTSTLEPQGDSAGFVPDETSSNGSKLFLGWRFGSRWSAELNYTDAGSVDLSNPNPVIQAMIPDAAIDYSVTSLFVGYHLTPVDSRFDVYAKLGASSVSAKPSDDRIIIVNDATTPLSLGLGAEFRFGRRWFLRLEHEKYSEDAAFSSLALGVRLGTAAPSHTRSLSRNKPLPVVIEYPLYIPEQQTTVLAEDRGTVIDVAGELRDISQELLRASASNSSESPKKKRESEHLARQAGILVETSKRLAIVEESIARTANIDANTIDRKNFVNDKGEKLLLTPAEQSIELGTVRKDIGRVEKAVDRYSFIRQRLSRVRGRIAVVEESLLFVPPWEEEEAGRLCDDFAEKGQMIHFSSESLQLTAGSKRVLDEIAEKMNRNNRVVMEVHAHTDSWGTFAFNQKLSEERAQATVDYLVEHGVARVRLVPRGYGETRPLDKNISRTGRAQNRRVEFVIKNPNICTGKASPE